MKKMWKKFWNDNRGVGIVEIILILVVLIALVVIFREKIMEIVNNAMGTIENDSSTIIGNGN